MVGFTLNIAAYNAGYMGTAYNGLDPAELEAGRAQGFNDRQMFAFITLPQVLRLSVPALTNQVILNLKDTSVAFLIQYTEFFARIQELAATNFQFFKAYMLAAGVYLALVSAIVVAARWVEWSRQHEARARGAGASRCNAAGPVACPQPCGAGWFR